VIRPERVMKGPQGSEEGGHGPAREDEILFSNGCLSSQTRINDLTECAGLSRMYILTFLSQPPGVFYVFYTKIIDFRSSVLGTGTGIMCFSVLPSF